MVNFRLSVRVRVMVFQRNLVCFRRVFEVFVQLLWGFKVQWLDYLAVMQEALCSVPHMVMIKWHLKWHCPSGHRTTLDVGYCRHG